MGRDSSVSIATRWLDGPGIESQWWGVKFSAPIRTDPGALPSLLYNWYRVFPQGKAAGSWSWLSTPCSLKVKERVELHFTPPMTFMSWCGENFTLTYAHKCKFCGKILPDFQESLKISTFCTFWTRPTTRISFHIKIYLVIKILQHALPQDSHFIHNFIWK